MVVSFKISRVGTRYRPKPILEPEPESSGPELSEEDEVDTHANYPQMIQSSSSRKRSVDVMEDYRNSAESSDAKVSFILSIFENGYTIVDASESDDWRVHDDSQFLRPYDRRSESMITAIECGYLPSDFLDDIQCKYINGTVLCEVRDYRNESSKSAAGIPSVKKVTLKMTLNDVLKDIDLIYDKTWEYGDLLEMEARILLALQPKLNLDPTPNLERLCREPTTVKLNLDIREMRLKRLRPVTEPESSKSRDPENILQDHFLKIKMLTARFNLNCKINKLEDDHKPAIRFSAQQVKQTLSDNQDNDILEDGPCKMPLSMSLMGGNINICKTRLLNFELKEPPVPENESAEIPKYYTGLILSERRSDGTVTVHNGDLDAIDYLPNDQLLPPLKNTHMADLLAKQYCDLMLREGYKPASDHLKIAPASLALSAGGQPDTTPEDFNKWLVQILKDDPRELFYELNEPSSHHNMHPQSTASKPGASTARNKQPCVVHSYWESQGKTKPVRQQSQIQRPMLMRPVGNHFSTVGFQGLGMGQNQTATRSLMATRALPPMMGQNPMATRGLSPLTGQNPTATRRVRGQRNTNVQGGSGNVGGLQGVYRQSNLGFGSGSGSGSSGGSMLGSGTGINRADHLVQMTQNRYMNHQQQQQFQLIKQEPTSSLQAVSGSGSGPSGVITLGSGVGTNRFSDVNAMQMAQNRHMNQQQLQLIKQEPVSNLQAVSSLSSWQSGVITLDSGTGNNMVSGMNTMQMAQNHHMNQHQLQLIKQESTSHLQAVSGSGSGSSGVGMLFPGAGINRANDINAMQLGQNRYMNQQQFQQVGSGSGSGSSGIGMLVPGAGINRANDINAMQLGQNRCMNQQQFQQVGSGSGSGSSAVVMLGPGACVNRANSRNVMQMAPNCYMNQQQFQQDGSGSGSGSGSSSVIMLGSDTDINKVNEMNTMQRNYMACLSHNQNQNHYINQQQFQLVSQLASNLQAESGSGSGSGSGQSAVVMLGPSTGIKRPNDMMNPVQRNVMARLNPNHHMNQQQQQFQLVQPEPTSQQAGSPSPSTGRPHQMAGPHQPTQ